MNAPYLDDEMSRALKLWDGRSWFVEKPEDFVSGLFNFDQLQARDILRDAHGLTNWEAEVCQRAYYRDKPASPRVRHWLDTIERDKCGRVAL